VSRKKVTKRFEKNIFAKLEALKKILTAAGSLEQVPTA
jgi:hypothetical protein